MKRCSSCKEEKEEHDFFYKNKQKARRHEQCKLCYASKRKSYYTEHYQKYKDIYKARARTRKKRVQEELKKKLLHYLADKACVTCGITDPRVLDFDHINTKDKSFTIARALADSRCWEVILNEIAKCQILCANCHRIRTAEQFNWYRR
jgi:hypothetical protein